MRSQPGNLVTLAFFSQIKCIVGDSCGGFPYMLDKKTTSKDETEHEIDIQKKLLSSIFPAETTQSHSLDIGIWNMHYEIPFDEYILILPNSGDIKKELKPQEWVKKTKFINKNIILTGDKENSELCKLLSKRNNVLNLSMKLKLNNLLKIIVGASHVYCLDSFGGHFSALINKRTDVFIKNDEYNLLRWGPRGKYVKFIR
jgi:ADP-heptose:LPS heptosyltransferase